MALLLALSLALLLGAALLLDRLNHTATYGHAREAATATGLAEAKRGLIAWAVSVPSAGGRQTTPGLLPFPDRNRDGNYDGKGDCVTFGLNDTHLLGRLPWAGDVSPCPRVGLYIDVRDSSGERLWYAVSRNLVTNGGGGPINPDMGESAKMIHPWIILRDAKGNPAAAPGGRTPLPIAAVIIAPGAALDNQDRRAAAPSPDNYLDRVTIGGTTYDNADSDGCPDAVAFPCGPLAAGEEFIFHRASSVKGKFNDRLIYITVNELMRAVEKRALGETAVALNRYRDAFGAYPWLAEFRSPEAVASGTAPPFKSTLSRNGVLPVHLPGEVFATRFGGSWIFSDATPTIATRHSGDVTLVPPLADGMSGSIQVPSSSGRCLWSDWTRGDCTGSRVIPAYHRVDLGTMVTRTVEYSFAIVDDTPQVVPPMSGDVRRRNLSVNTRTLPRSPSAGWSIRITDDDGINKGQRDIFIDADTGGEISLRGIRYDLSVVYDDVDDARDELPEWFAENNWHHFIYVALSADAVPGGNADGDGDCKTPVNTCLTLNASGRVARSDVRALVISSSARLLHQDRAMGDCDGDGVADDFLCAYLEGDNSDKSTPDLADTYARGGFNSQFNDQVRIVDPLPP
jgi:hypothetical protein